PYHRTALYGVRPNSVVVNFRCGRLEPGDTDGYSDNEKHANCSPDDLTPLLLPLEFWSGDIHVLEDCAHGMPSGSSRYVIEISTLSVRTAVFNLMANVRSWNLLSRIGHQVGRGLITSLRQNNLCPDGNQSSRQGQIMRP